MWYFLVIALLASGERTDLAEIYAFPQREACTEIQEYGEEGLSTIGGFEVTPCKFTPFNDKLDLPEEVSA